MLVNPAFPNLEGKNLLDAKDTQGKPLIRDMIKVADTSGSGWVDYMWPKPGESVSTQKSTYVSRARLERLQQAYAAQLNKPVASRFLPFDPDFKVEDYDRLQEEELDRINAAGEIKPSQRARVKLIRWLTREEHAERKQLEVDGPVPAPVRPSR